MDEGELRHLFGKYSREELITGYNGCVRNHILPRMEVSPTIHLPDCTKTEDTEKTARQIILACEMRPEMEEDYRQLKDFRQPEDFKSTKLSLVAFHMVCTLLGYLLFQLYVGTGEGERWAGQSLPVVVKTRERKRGSPAAPGSVIVYSGGSFGVFAFVEFIRLYATLPASIRLQLDGILSLV